MEEQNTDIYLSQGISEKNEKAIFLLLLFFIFLSHKAAWTFSLLLGSLSIYLLVIFPQNTGSAANTYSTEL